MHLEAVAAERTPAIAWNCKSSHDSKTTHRLPSCQVGDLMAGSAAQVDQEVELGEASVLQVCSTHQHERDGALQCHSQTVDHALLR